MAKKANKSPSKCGQHSCNERDNLRKCPYCERLFCKEHLGPKPVGMPRFHDTSPLAQKFMDEFHRSDGHACFPYTEKWAEDIEKKDEAYGKALNAFLSKKPKQALTRYIKIEDEPVYEPSSERYKDYTLPKDPKTSKSPTFRTLGRWLNHREHHSYDYSRIFSVFLWKIIVFAISLGFLAFALFHFYSLNQLLIWFVPLGWIVIAVAGFFALKSLFVFLKEFPNWLKRQPRWVKLLIIILIAFYVWKAYTGNSFGLGHSKIDSWESSLSTADLNMTNTAFALVNSFRQKNGIPVLEI
jgi:hypothetical protein